MRPWVSCVPSQLTHPASCLLSAVWPGANSLASLILSSHFCSGSLGTYLRVLTIPSEQKGPCTPHWPPVGSAGLTWTASACPSVTIPSSSCPGDRAPEFGCCLVCGDTCWPHVEIHVLRGWMRLTVQDPPSPGTQRLEVASLLRTPGYRAGT